MTAAAPTSAPVSSLALVNRFIPPDAAPTAVALARLATLLAARAPDLRLEMTGADRRYVGAGAAGETRLWRRGLTAWRDGRRLAIAAAERDAVLSLTDPPFLAWRLARRLRPGQRWIEWTMDLYPQALRAALGLGPGGLFPRPWDHPWDRLWSRRRPDLRLCLGPGQAAFLAAADAAAPPCLILPAGVRDPVSAPTAPSPITPGSQAAARIRLVYAGNLGRAHWDDALPLLAAACDPARFHLTVAAYGAGAARQRAQLAGFPHVDWREAPLSDAELDAADVHVVSLQAAWTHVCAPSKAISALCRGRPVLFFGAPGADAWGWADGGGWRIDPAPAAAKTALPDVLREIAAPPRMAAALRRAAAAGDRLRTAETAAVNALAAWLIEGQRRLNIL